MPALFGGIRIVVGGEKPLSVALPIPRGLKLVLFVPDKGIDTKASRKVLPKKVSLEDAVRNIGRACVLVASLFRGDLSLLKIGTEDFLHQPHREKLMPWMRPIMDAALSGGSYGAFLSGGGSSIGAFCGEGAEDVANGMKKEAERMGIGGRVIITEPTDRGVYEDNSSEVRRKLP